MTIIALLILLTQTVILYQVWPAKPDTSPPPSDPTRYPTYLPTNPDLLAAVKQAFVTVGLPGEQFSETFNLVPTGKLYDVLSHTSEILGDDHNLRTVADIVSFYTPTLSPTLPPTPTPPVQPVETKAE